MEERVLKKVRSAMSIQLTITTTFSDAVYFFQLDESDPIENVHALLAVEVKLMNDSV